MINHVQIRRAAFCGSQPLACHSWRIAYGYRVAGRADAASLVDGDAPDEGTPQQRKIGREMATTKGKTAITIGTAVAALGIIAGCTSADASSPDTSPAPKVSKGVGARDATKDVVLGTYTHPHTYFELPEVPVTVTNHSSKRSTYFITVALESPDGKTKYDDTIVVVNGLEPGQTTEETASFLSWHDTGVYPVKPVAKEIQRTAT
jgi:hypothetical protein